MNLLKAVLATALVATLIGPWNAGGFDGTSAAPENGKEPIPLIERLRDGELLRVGEFDTYDLDESHAEFLGEIHTLTKGTHPDELFSTALSDSAIVRQPDGDAWLIRVFYTPEDRSPSKDTVWIAKLTEQELPSFPSSPRPHIFTISEVVPVRIPKMLAGFMGPFRATKTVVSERESKLASMWQSINQSIENLEGAEEFARKQAEMIRQHGHAGCCPRDSYKGLSDEEVARKMERHADEARVSRDKLIETRDSLRSVILRQAAPKEKPQ